MIEFLKYSKICKALMKSATVLIVYLSSTYSSAIYNKKDEIVTFEKGLPPHWNAQFTILFKSFSERTSGTDSASKPFYTLIYGLYHDLNLDYGSFLWNQFVESLNYKNRHCEISCARFWFIGVQRAITKHDIRIMTDSLMAAILILPTATFVTTNLKDFKFIGSIPLEMTNRVPNGVQCVAAYCKLPPSGDREITPELQEAFDKLENPRKVKTKNPTPPSEHEESEGRTLSDPVKGALGPNKEEDDTGNIGHTPLSPPHDPTPKTTPKSTPKPTPNNSPSPSRKTSLKPTPPNSPPHSTKPTPQNSPSPSPKNTTIPSPTHQSPPSEEMLFYDEQDEVDSPFTVRLHVNDDSAPITQGQFKDLSAKLDLLLESTKAPSSSDWQSQLEEDSQGDLWIRRNTEGREGGALYSSFRSIEGKFRNSLVPRCKGGATEERSSHGKRRHGSAGCQNDKDSTSQGRPQTHFGSPSLCRRLKQSNLKGVSKGDATPKQGGDENEETQDDEMNDEISNPNNEISNNENPTKPFFSIIGKVNEPGTKQSADETQTPDFDWFKRMKTGESAGPSSTPSKRRGKKKIGEDDVNEEPEIIDAAKSARDARDKEPDALKKLTQEFNAEEAAARDAEYLLKTRKSLFPDWSFDRMVNEAIKEPVINLLGVEID
ncbi:hypothetical protein L1887_23223 [Cichorium endivia]|nr:hypothetical protein L1887_23223 [Cichorium endivia]